MEELSTDCFKTSQRGRILIPRLKGWTGERVSVRKSGKVEILKGVPDCTSTFKTERSLFNEIPSSHLSNTLQCDQSSAFPKVKASKSFSGYKASKLMPKKQFQKEKPTGKEEMDAKNMKEKIRRKHSSNKSLVEKRKRSSYSRAPSPRKNLKKRCPDEEDEPIINIFGPAFQPYVYLVRLLPEEILALTMKHNVEKGNNKQPKSNVEKVSNKKQQNPNLRSAPNRKKSIDSKISEKSPKVQKSPKKKRATKPMEVDENVNRDRSLSRRQPRTVKETQQMLRVLNQSKENEEVEDEAASTAGFFHLSPTRGISNQRCEGYAVDILKGNYESDDNLSIRALSERESSPMSSAVSPIGSAYETDAEMSGREDGLFRATPTLGNRTSFHRAKLLHKTLKDREKLKKKTKADKKNDLLRSPSSQTIEKSDPTFDSQLLKPRAMRALEKNIKEKAESGRFEFSAMYRGNLLHISVNSDSDSDESDVDSLNDF